MNIITLFGNIGSGKSTVSRRILDVFPETVYVSDDMMWTMLGGNSYKFGAIPEPVVFQAMRRLVIGAASAGKDVIVDTPAHTHKRREMFEVDPSNVNHVAIYTGWHEDPAEHASYRFNKESRGVSLETWLSVATRLNAEREMPKEPWKVVPVGRVHASLSKYTIYGPNSTPEFSGGLSGVLQF